MFDAYLSTKWALQHGQSNSGQWLSILHLQAYREVSVLLWGAPLPGLPRSTQTTFLREARQKKDLHPCVKLGKQHKGGPNPSARPLKKTSCLLANDRRS
jgi:hypothetical protein